MDGAENSKIKAVKGGLSDSFKRAAVLWGIGRYLYCFGQKWVDVEKKGDTSYIKQSEYAALDAFHDDEKIKTLKAELEKMDAAKPVPPDLASFKTRKAETRLKLDSLMKQQPVLTDTAPLEIKLAELKGQLGACPKTTFYQKT